MSFDCCRVHGVGVQGADRYLSQCSVSSINSDNASVAACA